MVSSDWPVVAAESARTLIAERSTTPTLLWAAALDNSNDRVHLGALKLFRPVTMWARVQIYLEAAAHPKPAVCACAALELRNWVDTFDCSFAQPPQSDKSGIARLPGRAAVHLESHFARKLTFLLETALR